jgi:MFS family permease
LRRDVFLLSLAAFASAASLRATDPLLPLIAAEYRVSASAASAAVTAFTLSYGLFQIVCGPLGDRFGRYATIAAAGASWMFGLAACGLAVLAALSAATSSARGARSEARCPVVERAGRHLSAPAPGVPTRPTPGRATRRAY